MLKIIKYMSKISRNVILPESKKQRSINDAGGWSIMQAKFNPPRLGAGKLKSPPQAISPGGLYYGMQNTLGEE